MERMAGKITRSLIALGVVGFALGGCRNDFQDAADKQIGDLSCVQGDNAKYTQTPTQEAELARTATAQMQLTLKTPLKTSPSKLDLVFAMDSTGSMRNQNRNLRDQFNSIIDYLLADQNKTKVTQPAFAVVGFEDFPATGGRSADKPFTLYQAMTTDRAQVQTALDAMYNESVTCASPSVACGGDVPEISLETLSEVATGAGFDYDRNGTFTNANDIKPYSQQSSKSTIGSLGGVGFRADAFHMVVLGTDACFKSKTKSEMCVSSAEVTAAPSGTADFAEAIANLKNMSIWFVGLGSQPPPYPAYDPMANLNRMASETGALKQDGTPMVYPISADGSNVASQIIESLKEVVDKILVRVTVTVPDGISAQIAQAQPQNITSGTELATTITFKNDNILGKCYRQYFNPEVKYEIVNPDGSVASYLGSTYVGLTVPASTVK